MPVTEKQDAFVDATSVSVGLSQMFTVTAAATNPTYLIVSALDRDEYTARANGTTGQFVGNNQVLPFSNIGSDGRGAGIAFTYQPTTGRYYNNVYGYFDQLGYTSSSSAGDVTNISVYGTNDASIATQYGGNAWSMMQLDPGGYLGSATVVTQSTPTPPAAVPAAATPNSIASIADSFVGQAWNMDGCWTLASTIAADAGSSLPVQSSEIGMPGVANGEWMVAYNGPAGQSANWQSLVTTGDMVVFLTGGNTGHITTCVSGSGSTAQLVDNITYVNATDQVVNPANDGSADDVVVSAAHPASEEFDGVSASSVVIYRLDTPVVSVTPANEAMTTAAPLSLGGLFTATDPAGKPVTEWQVYDTAASDGLSFNGSVYSAHSAAAAITVGSLSSVSLVGSTAASDTVAVRAFNGGYWGDWQSVPIAVQGAPVSPPSVTSAVGNQVVTEGRTMAFTLPAGSFADPQHQALSLTATQASGQALPGWLAFNPVTQSFSGMAPATPQTLALRVTATDVSGLSASEQFSLRVQAPEIRGVSGLDVTLSDQTQAQDWVAGQTVAMPLPAQTFSDIQNQRMSFAAYQESGPSVSPWLHINASNGELYGTVPADVSGTVQLAIMATDTSGQRATDLFTVNLAADPTSHAVATGSAAGPGAMSLASPALTLIHPS